MALEKKNMTHGKVFKRNIEGGVPVIEDYEEIEVPVTKRKEGIFSKHRKNKK